MKIFAALGPGDIVSAHLAIMNKEEFTSETSITYSGQITEFCRQRGIRLLGVSHNGRTDKVQDGSISLENRPRLFEGHGSVRYHLKSFIRGIYLACRAWKFGADLALVDNGSANFFSLSTFALFKIPVVIDFHNTIWPNKPGGEKTGNRLLRFLDRWFFRNVAAGAIGVSPECGRQVRFLAGQSLPYFDYRAQYHRIGFTENARPTSSDPFCVLFVGRIERNKGALDIPEIAVKVKSQAKNNIIIHVCGDGADLNKLKSLVEANNISDLVKIHGKLDRPDLINIFNICHVVLVPTHGDFCEGLPKACAEAVICGLPIVTSQLSNAFPVLGPAIAQAQPDNIDSYVSVITRLSIDELEYHRLKSSCKNLELQFFERSQSLPSALDRIIACIFPGWEPLTSYDMIFDQLTTSTKLRPV